MKTLLQKKINHFQIGKVLFLSFCHFVHDIYLSFLASLLPMIIEKFSLNLTQAGFLSTMMQIPAFLNPYLGKLADRISVRYFIIMLPGITAVSTCLLGLAPNYFSLLLLLFIAGISTALFHVPSPVMIHKLSGKSSGKGMSFYMTGGELARTVGPIIIIAVVSHVGFEGYYTIMAIGIAASILMFLKFKDTPLNIGTQNRISIPSTFNQMRHIFILLSAILITRGFMHASLTVFLPMFIKQATGNIWLSGISLAILEAAGVAGIITIGTLSDKLGRKNTLLVSLIIAPLSLLLFIHCSGWIQNMFLIVTGFSFEKRRPSNRINSIWWG